MDKLLFLRSGFNSHTNAAVRQQLEKHFPELELIDWDAQQECADLFFGWQNRITLMGEYGGDFLSGRKSRHSWKDWAEVTSFAFKNIRKRLRREFGGRGDIRFSFQMQSLFDGSIPGIPNFVYTDSTVLANYQYPNADPSGFLKSPAWMALEEEIYRNARCNFVFSDNQALSLLDDYGIPGEQVVNVRAGSNLQIAEPELYGQMPEPPRILFVGVDWERKGGPVLLEAFRRLRERLPACELHIVGCSPSVSESAVHIHGRIPLDEVEEHYRNATVFCLPTRKEPFGIAVVEAMLRKLPVVVSDIGAMPEMVIDGRTGYCIAPDDTHSFAQRLIEICTKPGLAAEMGMRGREHALDCYTWDRSGEQIHSEIQSRLV